MEAFSPIERNRHLASLDEYGIEPIDLVICNLYPYSDPGELIGMADYHGACAAKTPEGVGIIVDPNDYETVLAELSEHGTPRHHRRQLARTAFAHTAHMTQPSSSGLTMAIRYPPVH